MQAVTLVTLSLLIAGPSPTNAAVGEGSPQPTATGASAAATASSPEAQPEPQTPPQSSAAVQVVEPATIKIRRTWIVGALGVAGAAAIGYSFWDVADAQATHDAQGTTVSLDALLGAEKRADTYRLAGALAVTAAGATWWFTR